MPGSNARKHGQEGTRIYDCWVNMKQRCLNKKAVGYSYYGGRGISVSKRWNRFENFFKDMGPMPAGKTIERINPNKNYSRSNCKWASKEEQSLNKRNTRFLKIGGERKALTQWAREFKIRPGTVFQRIDRDGLSPIEALTKPLRIR